MAQGEGRCEDLRRPGAVSWIQKMDRAWKFVAEPEGVEKVASLRARDSNPVGGSFFG